MFGQLPHAKIVGADGAVVDVSQSNAIVRVLSRRGGLEGKTDADFAMSGTFRGVDLASVSHS